ncbi:MAG: UvrD-helicase domain-containing protein, partial [Chloroflexi bacterium]|nr:UvrD-helicase domain-containing protein [Chloroflexota bacterium]
MTSPNSAGTPDVLQGLNPAQKEAVETIDGPLLIIAGPGSGKTRVITHRIAYLVRDCQVNPRRIMAVTFTNKAAREMRNRMDRLVGPRSESLTLGTFHSFCARMLRTDGSYLGLPTNY